MACLTLASEHVGQDLAGSRGRRHPTLNSINSYPVSPFCSAQTGLLDAVRFCFEEPARVEALVARDANVHLTCSSRCANIVAGNGSHFTEVENASPAQCEKHRLCCNQHLGQCFNCSFHITWQGVSTLAQAC